MQIIEDFNQIKSIVDQNFEYTTIGFTKSNLFNMTHEYMYQQSLQTLNSNRKLFGIVWDNLYDIQVYLETQSPKLTEFNLNEIIQWFETRNFEYLFIPNINFIFELMNHPVYKEVCKEVDKIWSNEKYQNLIGKYNTDSISKWIKLVLTRQHFLFSGILQEKVFNRTCQLFAPDGTWGFIYRHFFEKYCGGTYSMIPLLRNEDGTPFDVNININPQQVKDLFPKLVIPFNKFRQSRDLDLLISECTEIINKFEKFRNMQFQLIDFESFKDPEITFDKYIFKIQFKNNYLRDNNQNDMFKYWEYDEGI